MEDQSEDIGVLAGGGGEGQGERPVKTEDVEDDCQKTQTDVSDPDPDPDAEVEDHEALPHSEILDIFEEGLAQLVQDPLLCDLPIQVLLFICSLSFMLLMTTHSIFISNFYSSHYECTYSSNLNVKSDLGILGSFLSFFYL